MQRAVVSLLLAFLFATLVWGQAEKSASSAQGGQSTAAAGTETKDAAMVAPDEPVISIDGVCDNAGTKKKASDCKTEITRAQFEELVAFVEPGISPERRRLFAKRYADTLIMAQQAHEMGLDSGPRFDTLLQLQRGNLLRYLVGQALQEKAQQIPEADIENYYGENRSAFETIELEELYVPAAQQIPLAGKSEDEVMKLRRDSIDTMKKVADELRTRTLAGENVSQLQVEAYKAAGNDAESNPTKVKMEKYRRSNLPASQLSVMNLKPGEVSQVFDESNGHYIYKAGPKQILPLEEVRDEISRKLRTERLQQYRQEVHEAAKATLNKAYFAASSPPSPGNELP